MSEKKWKWLTDETWLWKGHIVNDDLAPYIQMDLHDRAREVQGHDCTFLLVDAVDEVYLDMPGMILAERAERTIDLNGLTVRVPSQDWEDILNDVKLLKQRELTVDGVKTPYYKFNGWRFSVVLTPAERQALIEAMEKQLAEAEPEADVDRRRFVKGLENMPGVVSAKATAIRKALDGNKDVN